MCLVCLWVLERCSSGRIRLRARFTLTVGRIFLDNFGFLWIWEIRRQNGFSVFVVAREVLQWQGMVKGRFGRMFSQGFRICVILGEKEAVAAECVLGAIELLER
jgi:hypothetical protein